MDWYADLLDKYEFTEDLGVAEAMGGRHSRWVEKEPVGVVAAIVPYNYPVQITLAKLVPALAAGCTVVVKAPPQCPGSAPRSARSSPRTPTSRRASSTSYRRSSRGGRGASPDPLVDMVSFTGSTAVGRRIMAAASETVKKTCPGAGASRRSSSWTTPT